MDLSLRFEDNGTAHNDLVLQFDGQRHVCDSYFLLLDQELLPEREDTDKVWLVLRRLLEQWLAAVERLPDSGTAYLPYDFSDEYSGWLACQRSGDEVTVSQGHADLEGWTFSPSAIPDLYARPRGFYVSDPAVRGTLEELVTAVRGSLAEVRWPVAVLASPPDESRGRDRQRKPWWRFW